MYRCKKHIKLNIVAVAFLLVICMITGCGKKDEKQLASHDAGAPYSDWGESCTGSAKYLDGDSLLVSIFLEYMGIPWSDDEKRNVRSNMNVANEYLIEQGIDYGKRVNLIYNLNEYSDICFTMPYYDPELMGEDYYTNKDDPENNLYWSVSEYIDAEISVKRLMERYDVNSIGFMVFMNTKSDKALTYPYYEDTSEVLYKEICLINYRWESNNDMVTPDTYAHEILHLFGARDLYRTSEADGITRDFVQYAANRYPKDIMLGNSSDVVAWKKRISSKIEDVTAYYLGWKDEIRETSAYPSVKANNVATFTHVYDTYGNYSDYELPSKTKPFSYVIMEIVCVVLILFVFVRSFIKERAKYRVRNQIIDSYIILDEPDEIEDGYDNFFK